MTALYLSGTYLTLARHEWLTWAFARNVTFNLLGFSMLVYAYRAIWLFRQVEAPVPSLLDRGSRRSSSPPSWPSWPSR